MIYKPSSQHHKTRQITMKKTKLDSIKKTFEILRHNRRDLKGTIAHLSDNTINLILEIVSNIVFNKKLFSHFQHKKCFRILRTKMKMKRKKWLNILSKTPPPSLKSKKKFILSQTGAGSSQVLETLLSFLPSLLMLL